MGRVGPDSWLRKNARSHRAALASFDVSRHQALLALWLGLRGAESMKPSIVMAIVMVTFLPNGLIGGLASLAGRLGWRQRSSKDE